MGKISRAGGATISGGATPENTVYDADTNRVIDGNLTVVGDLTVAGLSDVGPAPSVEIDYAEKTSPQVVSLNTLLIAAITDMVVDVENLPVPQYVTAVAHGSHASADAFYAIVLADPATSPTIVTSGIALEYGSMGAAGSNESVIAFARIPPNTAAHTIQAYIAGTAGNFTVGAQSYSKCTIRVETR